MCKKSYFYDFKIQILHYEKTFLIMKMSKNFILGPPFTFFEFFLYIYFLLFIKNCFLQIFIFFCKLQKNFKNYKNTIFYT